MDEAKLSHPLHFAYTRPCIAAVRLYSTWSGLRPAFARLPTHNHTLEPGELQCVADAKPHNASEAWVGKLRHAWIAISILLKTPCQSHCPNATHMSNISRSLNSQQKHMRHVRSSDNCMIQYNFRWLTGEADRLVADH